MATKTFYVTRDMKHPLYRGRMLTAGQALELDGPAARLYTRLGAISNKAPKRAERKTETADLEQLTKAELAKRAKIDAKEAKKLTKADLIAKLTA